MAEQEQAAAGAAAPAAAQEASILDSIIDQSRAARSDSERARARDLISELVNEVMQGQVTVSQDLIASIEARIAAIDKALSEQLSAVMHNESFQKLEASWRGVHY